MRIQSWLLPMLALSLAMPVVAQQSGEPSAGPAEAPVAEGAETDARPIPWNTVDAGTTVTVGGAPTSPATSVNTDSFDLSSFGGTEETTAANGARVRRDLTPTPAVAPPVDETDLYRVAPREGAQAAAGSRDDLPEGCERTASGYTCSRTIIRGDRGGEAERRLREMLAED